MKVKIEKSSNTGRNLVVELTYDTGKKPVVVKLSPEEMYSIAGLLQNAARSHVKISAEFEV